ncbi:MAG: glycosyltransferase family 2 protein [Anaerolineae bacterium]|nr:glycosyltransferase family 2 protein [Anaerolineae bacterium]
MSQQVCAVVVTYNRKELLVECLEALDSQTCPVDQIFIIDNASTDGTYEFLADQGYFDEDEVEFIGLPGNRGGAGGFYEGLKRAYADQYDWIWVMDDDSIPEPDALQQLLAAYQRLEPVKPPKLLASRAVWLDRSLHPMNIPQAKTSDPDLALLAAEQATMSIRFATFVSLLLHRSVIDGYGLPIADYFIWSDDIEYTARILKQEFGVAVPASVVVHKTAKKYTHLNDSGPRYYYHIRNNIWMLTRSRAWTTKEKIKKAINFVGGIGLYLLTTRFRWTGVRSLTLGVKDGLFKAPRLP